MVKNKNFSTPHHKNIKITHTRFLFLILRSNHHLKISKGLAFLASNKFYSFSLNTKRPFKALKNIACFYLLSFKLINKYDASSVRIQSIGPIKLSLYNRGLCLVFCILALILPSR